MKQQIVLAFKFLTLAGVYLFTRARTPNHRYRNPDKSMVVVFVLEYVKRILVYNACLIRDAKNEVEILENDIRLFKAFLKECARIRRKEEAVEEFISEIQGVVRQGDDLIVGYWNIVAEIRDRNFLQRNFGSQMKLIGVAKEVKAMKVKDKAGHGQVLSWAQRVKIPLCAAKGLLYFMTNRRCIATSAPATFYFDDYNVADIALLGLSNRLADVVACLNSKAQQSLVARYAFLGSDYICK